MNTLRENVTDYLATRRALGFKLEGLSKLLLSFVAFCEQRGATRVNHDLVIQWATTQMKVPVSEALVARRLDAVRIFARYQHALDPATQIPAEELRPRRYRPKQPNVLNQNDICALLAATSILEPAFKALTWRILIGLLTATGLRPGEACRLAVSDINLASGMIQILETKFGKSRLVFIHPSTVTVIADYLQARQAWVGASTHASSTVFLNARRGPLCPDRLNGTFREIVTAAGLTTAPGHRPVRLHDLRHTFAVTTMIDWYREGQDVQARLPLLSTWLGHVDPASTYWYLHAVPELLALAADRLDNDAEAPVTEPAP
ncbi:tyrosine-type recombinase/integrase [Mycobacterium riyadhense]|nr:tyrosine-type recombinase/integrase [Mycobacterium riyadhense]